MPNIASNVDDQSLRGFLQMVETDYPDELLRISQPVNPRFDMTAIVFELERAGKSPVVIFERPEANGMQVVTNVAGNRKLLAACLGVEPQDLPTAFRERCQKYIPCETVKDAAWNEGGYLVEGLGHCAACHSPRNFMGARTTPAYGGGSAEGWYAPPLNKDNLSQQPWTKLELVTYLMDGWQAKHGMAAGPMTPVVDALHKQNEIDVFAIAAYVETLRAGEKPIDQAAVRAAALRLEWGNPHAPPVPEEFSEGGKVFEARCAQCHRSMAPPCRPAGSDRGP